MTPREADETAASYVVKMVQCENGPPRWRVSRPRVDVGVAVPPGTAVSAPSVDEAVTADPTIPRVEYQKREVYDQVFLFTHADGGKTRVALVVVPNSDVPGQWEWSTVAACDGLWPTATPTPS